MQEIRSRIDRPDIIITSSNNIKIGLHSPLLKYRWQYYSQNQKNAINLLSKLTSSNILEVMQYLYAGLLPKNELIPIFNDLNIQIPSCQPMERYRADMKSLYNSHFMCDFTLKFKTIEFPVHRFILASGSKYFANLFTSRFSEETSGVFTDEVCEKAKNLNDFLEYLYTGHADIIAYEDCFIFLNICRFYQIYQTKNEIEIFISKQIIRKFTQKTSEAITKARTMRFFVLSDILEACQV